MTNTLSKQKKYIKYLNIITLKPLLRNKRFHNGFPFMRQYL